MRATLREFTGPELVGCRLSLQRLSAAKRVAGRLVPVLGDLDTGETEAFHAVYVGQGGPLPSRVRALLDFLAEKGRVS